jgi:hypothetical protein
MYNFNLAFLKSIKEKKNEQGILTLEVNCCLKTIYHCFVAMIRIHYLYLLGTREQVAQSKLIHSKSLGKFKDALRTKIHLRQPTFYH